MKGHILTSEVQTKFSVQVVLPDGDYKGHRVLVDLGCQALAVANPNVSADQVPEKYEFPQQRCLHQANTSTPICLKSGVACLYAFEGTTLKVLSFPRSEPWMQKTLPSVHKGCCKMVERSFSARGFGLV